MTGYYEPTPPLSAPQAISNIQGRRPAAPSPNQDYLAPLRRTPEQHYSDSLGKLAVARQMLADHHNAVQDTLHGQGTFTGPQSGAENEQQTTYPRPHSFQQGAWHDTISEFRGSPTG